MGRTAKKVSANEAANYVAGYTIYNDVSERTPFMIEHVDEPRQLSFWYTKSFDTFGPTGPWLVTPDEVGDPQNLDLWLEVDGIRYQNGNTRTMVFGVAYLIHYLSQFFTLHSGDIISTGTPPGVGMGQKPEPIYLHAGQTMHIGVEKLGVQSQKLVVDV